MRVEVTVLGPYAWVPGRRATSKVTATSGGRLTNRYAWVTGRLARRAYLGVNLPLRVFPCKNYPEEVTELKMAALMLLRYRQRRLLPRNRIFRDRTNPLDKFGSECTSGSTTQFPGTNEPLKHKSAQASSPQLQPSTFRKSSPHVRLYALKRYIHPGTMNTWRVSA